MKRLGWILVVTLAVTPPLLAQDQAHVTAALAKLKAGTPEDQREALDGIATSLDPRIPAACLPLLESAGNSVQRNAARAIGSRWWQIPAKEQAAYRDKLKPLLESKHDDTQRMARRGIGLLGRSYEGDMFSRSHGKRWVVYERHGKPCLIDTTNGTEELLGAGDEGKFAPAYGNEPVAPCSHWHPKEDAVALDVIIFRRISEVWVWRHPSGLRVIRMKDVLPLLKPARGEVAGTAGFFMSFEGWKGRALELTVDYATRDGENLVDHVAVVRVDEGNPPLRLVSDKELR